MSSIYWTTLLYQVIITILSHLLLYIYDIISNVVHMIVQHVNILLNLPQVIKKDGDLSTGAS